MLHKGLSYKLVGPVDDEVYACRHTSQISATLGVLSLGSCMFLLFGQVCQVYRVLAQFCRLHLVQIGASLIRNSLMLLGRTFIRTVTEQIQ